MPTIRDVLQILELEDLGWLLGRATSRRHWPLARIVTDEMARRGRPDAKPCPPPQPDRNAEARAGSQDR